MGCFYSKNVRCLRCNKICDDEQLYNNTRICLQCVRDEQKLKEYRQRLAALYDDNASTGPTAVQAERIIIANVPRSNVAAQPRYIATKKSFTTNRQSKNTARPVNTKPLYGEYKCTCGRFWTSYRSWRSMYQKCQRCKKCVYPSLQRELLESEKSCAKLEEGQEHPEHLCEKCIRLGHNCKKPSYRNTDRTLKY